MPEPAEAAPAAPAMGRRVNGGISECPMPISGCDAQSGHLSDIRRRLERALAELDLPGLVPASRRPD